MAELPLAEVGSRRKKGKEEHRKQSTFLPRSPVASTATQKGMKKGDSGVWGWGGGRKLEEQGGRKTWREESPQQKSQLSLVCNLEVAK